jgi:hypothetical protein
MIERHPLFKWLPYIFLCLTAIGIGVMIFNLTHGYFFGELMAIPTGLLFLLVIGLAIKMMQDKGSQFLLSETGIDIDDTHFPWEEIRASFIVERPRGNKRSFISYLVLVMEDDSLEYFDLTGFPKWSEQFKKLCAGMHAFHPAT